MFQQSKYYQTRGGRSGQYLGQCEITKKHRFRFLNDKPFGKVDSTVYLADDQGRIRGPDLESDFDIVGEQPA